MCDNTRINTTEEQIFMLFNFCCSMINVKFLRRKLFPHHRIFIDCECVINLKLCIWYLKWFILEMWKIHKHFPSTLLHQCFKRLTFHCDTSCVSCFCFPFSIGLDRPEVRTYIYTSFAASSGIFLSICSLNTNQKRKMSRKTNTANDLCEFTFR